MYDLLYIVELNDNDDDHKKIWWLLGGATLERSKGESEQTLELEGKEGGRRKEEEKENIYGMEEEWRCNQFYRSPNFHLKTQTIFLSLNS